MLASPFGREARCPHASPPSGMLTGFGSGFKSLDEISELLVNLDFERSMKSLRKVLCDFFKMFLGFGEGLRVPPRV